MKTSRTFLILLLFIAGFTHQTSAKKLQTYVSYVTFCSPTDGPYIETYLAFAGNSIQFVKNDKNKYLSNIEITMIFSQNNTVKAFDKYFVKIPDQEDTLNVKNFIDHMVSKKFKLIKLHTGGHADIKTMQNMVNTINPKYLIPIHKSNHSAFTKHFSVPVIKLKDKEAIYKIIAIE